MKPPALLTPSQAAAVFGVNPKTLIKWANEGKIASQRTLGGHRRFDRSVIDALLAGEQADEDG